jgi:hypothetical protein
MRLAGTVVLVVLGMASATQVPGQSLAETAKREKQRRAQRKEKKEPARSFTDADLGRSGTVANNPSDPPAVDQRTSRAASRRPSAQAPSTSQNRGESYWRSRATQARARVAAAEKKLEEAERAPGAGGPLPLGDYKVNCKPGRLLLSDGTLGPVTNNCKAAQALGDARRRSHARVEAARRELEQARKALAALKEQARRAGALPGWLR